MANLKFALVVLLAVGAYQCQAANVPEVSLSVAEPEPNDLDIFLAAQHVIKIVGNIIAAVDKSIIDSKPSIDILVNQLTPELGKAIKKIIDDVLVLVKKEEQRIEFMIKEVENLLDAIKKIKTCTDPNKEGILKIIATLENTMLREIRGVIKNHSEPLNDLKLGGKQLLDRARKLFDTEIKNIIECIKPGTKNAKKCIDNEIEKMRKGIVKLVVDAALFASEAQEVIVDFAMDVLRRATPVIDKFMKDADPIMVKISDCIAKMK